MPTPQESLLVAISRTRNALHRSMEPLFRAHGLTITQFSILEALLHRGPLSVGQVRDAILGTPGNIPVVIDNLERSGYVTRNRCATDGRVSLISITPTGQELAERVFPLQAQRIEQLFASLDETEIADLLQLLTKARASIESV